MSHLPGLYALAAGQSLELDPGASRRLLALESLISPDAAALEEAKEKLSAPPEGALERAWWICEAARLGADASREGRRSGVVYTPRRLAEAAARAGWSLLSPLPRAPRLLDPACGAGALLLAAYAQSPQDSSPLFEGVDLDPVAVAITHLVLVAAGVTDARLRVGDALESGGGGELAAPRFDLCIANPPYQRANRRPRDRDRFVSARGAYDLYVLFMELGLERVRPGGVAVFITSNAFATSDYGAALRGYLERESHPRLLLDLTADRTFSALIDASLTAFQRRKASAEPAALCASGCALGPVEALPRAVEGLLSLKLGEVERQGGLLGEASLGLPWTREPRGPWFLSTVGPRRRLSESLRASGKTISDLVTLRTGVMGFQYRAALDALNESCEEGMKVVTPGLLSPFSLLWGSKEIRLGGALRKHPRLLLKPEALSEGTWSFFSSPKLLVSGIGRALTPWVDEAGCAAPLVAVHGAVAPLEICHALAALLWSAPMQWIARVEWSSAQIPRGSRRFAVGMLSRLPLPADFEAMVARLAPWGQQLAGDPSTLDAQARALGEEVCDLFGIPYQALEAVG